ncbi:hypothetical protein C0J52_20267 [Blattella germanica]|nr:hypothetical protein C0J52_20267 [Blattella germanica]
MPKGLESQGAWKAVNLDHFEPVDETVHHSTSAVDTVQIFDQIKIFWKRLGWPDAEAAFTFATNIVYDICQCSAFYADKINDKVERMYENEDLYERKFEVKKENLEESYKFITSISTDGVDFFKELDEDVITANSQLLKKIEKGLLFNAIGTTQLIHQYFLERREEQRKLETTPFGLITVKMQLVENVLTLEILNARNLRPLKKNSCNPFVKITFYPEDIFSQVPSMATKVHKKEVFPLFEERFTIAFSPEQLKVKDGLIMFTIKDKYLFGEDKYLGEALASFNDIVKTDPTVRFEAIEQLHLKINRPNNTGSEAFQALIRHEDKQAKDFIKKRKYMYCLESRT